MVFAEYAEQCEYWKIHPPTHKIAAAFIGYKPPTSAVKDEAANELAMEELIARFGINRDIRAV